MIIAFILILIHTIADFLFQTEDMARGKSKNIWKLLKHTTVYTIVFYFGFVFCYAINHQTLSEMDLTLKVFWFFPITFIFHTITDYITSRITSRLFEKKIYYTGIPNFGAFSVIGIDQVLHYAQLFLTYYYVTNGK